MSYGQRIIPHGNARNGLFYVPQRIILSVPDEARFVRHGLREGRRRERAR